MRYFFHIAYKGTAYHGWQRQVKVQTVQEVMEQALEKILKQPISCIGCGRTDAGVHASQYFFHIDYKGDLPIDLPFLLQKNLPSDIVVYEVFLMEGWPHAQFDAIARTYRYYFHTEADPFLSELSSFYPITIKEELLREALQLLPQHQEYSAFCKTPDRHASTQCQLSTAQLITLKNPTRFCIELSANRFLKNMVRLLVGQLLEVAQGHFSTAAFKDCLESGVAPKYPKVAYPQGLYLAKVTYTFGFGLPEEQPETFSFLTKTFPPQ